MQHKVPFIILVLLILALLSSMFLFSSQEASASSSLSRRVAEWLAAFLNPSYMRRASEATRNHVINWLILPVRKGAHFAEFALLGALAMGAALCLRLKMGIRIGCAALFSLVCAMADEFHQTFVSGRSGSPTDVLIDMGGALFGILVVWIFSLAVLYGMGHARLRRSGKRRKPKGHAGYMAAPPPEHYR